MRILFHSSAPDCRTGYGIVTREIVGRLTSAGHYVRIGTKHSNPKWQLMPDGMEVFEGTDIFLVNLMLTQENFDYIFTLWDIWILAGKRQFPKEKWIAYVPVNTAELSPDYRGVLNNTSMQIAQTRFGERVMEGAGYKPIYAPHGIDTKAYYPDAGARAEFRSDIGWTEENFVIGMVGINYADDTKGIVPLLLAFKRFHEAHNEARLFLCTLANERDVVETSINYHRVVRALGLEGLVGWPNQLDYFLCRMRDEDMRRVYNGLDVFCLPSRGESFGLPIIEAQACGTPVIVPNATGCAELCGAGGLIDVDMWDDAIWSPMGIWRYYCRPSRVLEQMEGAYNDLHDPAVKTDMKEDARTFAEGYDWNVVWPKYWMPIIAEMERRLEERKGARATA